MTTGIAAATLLPLAALAAPPATRSVTLYDGHVTLAIPSDWVEIPPELLRASTQGDAGESYQAGFQPAGGLGGGLGYPRVLVQVDESGRLPYAFLLDRPHLENTLRTTESRLVERSNPSVSEWSLDQLFFDPKRNALRMSASMNVRGVGRVGVHSALFLTEKGRFVLHCFELLTRFEVTAPLFDNLIRSVRIAAPIAYRRRFSDHWRWFGAFDWRHWTLAAVILALSATLALGARRSRRRRMG